MFNIDFLSPKSVNRPAIKIEKIGFDFDGVIADTTEAFIRIACEEYGYCSFTPEDITCFELQQCLDIPGEVVNKIFTDIMVDSLAAGLLPMAGAIHCLKEFAQNSKVTIITARPLALPVSDWLNTYIDSPVQDNIRVVATGDHNDKVRHIHQFGLKYFIDDRAETCTQLLQENITPFVFNQPWNKNGHGLQTVSNWQEIKALTAT